MSAISFFHSKKRNISPVFARSIGVCGHPFLISEYGSNQSLQFSLMKQIRFTDYRFGVTFGANHVVSNVPKLQEIISKADSFGVKLYPIISSGIDYTLTESANYANGFARGTAFAYTWGANFTHIEIGNEIENGLLLTGDGSLFAHYDATKYGKAREWIRGVANGIAAERPQIKTVVDAGWKHWGYTDKLIADGVRIDVIAWHWYSDMESSYPNQIAQALIARYPSKDIWFNEVNSRSQDDAAQAVFVASFNTYLSQFSKISKMFVYELFDEPNHVNTTERNYGMFVYNSNGTATYKPLANYFGDLYKPPIVHSLLPVIPTNIPEPALLTPVIDSSFGYDMEIIKISNDTHGYSKDQRWSSDMELCKVGDGAIHHGHNFKLLFNLAKQSGAKTLWSNLNNKKLFGFGANTIKVLTINSGNTSNTQTTLIDFALLGYDNYGPSLLSEGNTTSDDSAVIVEVKMGGVKRYPICNLVNGTIESYKTDAELKALCGVDSSGIWNWVAISKSGLYIVANRTNETDNTGGKYVFNRDWTPLMYNGSQVNLGQHSHMDFQFAANGREVMTKMGYPGYVDILTGVETQVLPTAQLNAAFGKIPGGHSSGTGETGWGLFSFHSVDVNNPYVVYAKLDGSNTFRCFVHARRSNVGNNYYNEIKGCISRDGKYVMYDSNWYAPNTNAKAYIARLK